MVLYQICVFGADLKSNMAARVHNVFHNFESILPKDHPCHVCFKLAYWFQKRRLLNNFPIPMAVWDLNSNLDVFSMQTFLRGLIYVR
jgi:hypothetical protein